ncbi:olfactory receptor 11L1-like [Pleurodeles waltl]|uniref:olfactory receptor 11L1-like n=1 Tax=Pleurodeles waltl TaxID=8319 RepID=UPI0037094744
MTGNILIVVTVSSDICLHLPMYFFLVNLSVLETWYMTVIAPSLLVGLLKKSNHISLHACLMQFFFFGWMACTECLLLTLMAFDRYIAICFPLQYGTLMNQNHCLMMTMGAWVIGFAPPFVTVFLLWDLYFCDCTEIDHFFCDFAPLLKAACSDTFLAERVPFVMSFAILSTPFLLIIASYVYIISAILRIPSSTGRHRAFSTCSSHLIVVVLYFGTLIALFVVPTSGHSVNLNKILSLLYTVVTPMINPVIYTLRNKEFRVAFNRVVHRKGL